MHLQTILLSLLVLLTSTLAAAPPTPSPPNIAGTGHLLIDMHSGQVLAENNADARLEPASLTKIMTTYVVFHELKKGRLKMDDEVLISEKAWKTPGSRMFIEVDKHVAISDLLNGMVIQSGNDASVALAEHIAGSEETFAQLMNDHALRLGMMNTNFMNATGLPHPDHYTTPRDISLVTKASIKDFPELYKLYAVKEFSWNDIQQVNRNKLLWRDKTVDGVKTGHTEAAGYCLVASAVREGMRLISVVMGTDSEQARAKASQSLLNYGFRFYETHRLYGANEPLINARIWKGEQEQAALGLSSDLYVTIARHRYEELQARTEVKQLVEAPVAQGDIMGKVIVEFAGAPFVEAPLVALGAVPEGGIVRTAVDTVLMMFE